MVKESNRVVDEKRDVKDARTYWEHEYVCEETKEVISILVPAGDTPPPSVETPKGGTAYKNFGASSVVIPAHHRAGSEEAATYDAGKRAMSQPHKNSFKEQIKNANTK